MHISKILETHWHSATQGLKIAEVEDCLPSYYFCSNCYRVVLLFSKLAFRLDWTVSSVRTETFLSCLHPLCTACGRPELVSDELRSYGLTMFPKLSSENWITVMLVLMSPDDDTFSALNTIK